jgi:DNA-binding NarL/FixJ family response regulator
MDLEMPDLSGIQTIEIAKQLYPQINFIVLTVFDDDDKKLFESIKAGVCGYLLKDKTAGSIYSAIINTLEFGGSPMSPGIARKALDLLSKATLPVTTDSTKKK